MDKRTNKRKVGDLAEDKVVQYAKQKGWKVLSRNFEKPWGEIDIIAKNKKTLVFIEVKALNAAFNSAFRPEEHFDYKKQRKVIRTCHSYLSENNYPEDTDYRIDLAAVELNFETRVARLRYYKNAIA